jgi:hypothetical protein
VTRRRPVDRFDGWIAGVGAASGLRVVVGCWPRSPFGAFADAMVERADGHRVLLAPTDAIAGYVAGTYAFDEVRVVPFEVTVRGAGWRLDAGPLALRFTAGRRPLLGVLLSRVPRGLATWPPWIRAAGLAARLVLPGVRTAGTAGGGRRELYAALDLRRIADGEVRWEGRDQGPIAPVAPPVRFGFGSTPAGPVVVRIVTLVRHRGRPGR